VTTPGDRDSQDPDAVRKQATSRARETPVRSFGADVSDPVERFRQLYSDNYTRLIGYARRRTPTIDDASDVVADTFLVAWRNLQKVPPGDGATPWLFGIARGVLANHQRGARRRSQLVRRVGYELQTQWVAPPATTDLQPLAQAFTRLSSTDREILTLCAWEGLGPRELAIALGCSVGAAKVRLFRARSRMKKSLEKQGSTKSTFEHINPASIELNPPRLTTPSATSLRRRQ
jgi:RNA polymerase sigma-70 factor, ECF subfamily